MAYSSSVRRLWCQYHGHAHGKSMSFSITPAHFAKMVSSDCHYCGAAPAVRPWMHKIKKAADPVNGIDRVNNARGYTKANTVPCCSQCNGSKYSRSAEDFIAHAKRVAAHNA